MQRKNRASGSTAVALILLIFLFAFTIATVYYFTAKQWFPPTITAYGQDIDRQFHRTLIITGIVFVLSQIALGWAVFRYRDRGQLASASHGNNAMEVLWTLATLVMFVGLGIYAERAWAEQKFKPAPPGSLQIQVVGQQFKWYFRYPGPDGKFGRIAPEFVNDDRQNFFGLDPNDPAGKDDLTTPVIAVPVDRDIELMLIGKDVIHSFYVRELRLKQDAVPGLQIGMRFRPTVIGRYEVACAELCGLGHDNMRSFLFVMSEPDYQNWLREQAAFAAQ